MNEATGRNNGLVWLSLPEMQRLMVGTVGMCIERVERSPFPCLTCVGGGVDGNAPAIHEVVNEARYASLRE